MAEWNEVRVIADEKENVSKYVFTKDDAVAEAVLYRYPTYRERTVICCSTDNGKELLIGTATDPLRRSQTLVDRLRGIYVIPVNDGAGLLNGLDTFTRHFGTPPIQHEAADEIRRLRLRLEYAEDDCINLRKIVQRILKDKVSRSIAKILKDTESYEMPKSIRFPWKKHV